MKNLKKSYLLVVSLLMITIYMVGCEKKEISDAQTTNEYTDNVKIDKENANAIDIENKSIMGLKDSEEKKVSTKIYNISNFHISDIWVEYEELDENENVISTKKFLFDITLSPSESYVVNFDYKEHTDMIKTVSYGYESGQEVVKIDLKNDTINISENEAIIENSTKYELLTISDVELENKQDEVVTYYFKVKNSSKKELSNISMVVSEIKDDEYTRVQHHAINTILTPSDEYIMHIAVPSEIDNLEIMGYTYDDISDNSNVSIDLKAQRAKINK